MMGPAEAIGTCLQKYWTFTGRASRAEFWWFFAFVALGCLVFTQLDSVLGLAAVGELPGAMRAEEGFEPMVEYRAPGPFALLFFLAALCPTLAAGARRFHDRSMTGWWLIAALVPIAGWILLLVFLGLEGTGRPNAYGPPPAASEG
ncbi:MAG: DUF805 domain-containing protein [Paracoccaceae bacterium]